MKMRRVWTLILVACMLAAVGLAAAEDETSAPQVQVSVFSDANRNGERAQNEAWLAGVTVELVRGGVAVASAETDASGLAVFEDAEAGEYVLRVTLPDEWGFSKTGAVKKKANPLNYNCMAESSLHVQEHAFTLNGEDVRLGVGAVRLCEISGRVWIDVNDDGVMQDEEPGYEGLAITVSSVKGGQTVTVYSGADGVYAATDLLPGSYEIKTTLDDNLTFAKYVKVGGTRRSIFSSEGSVTRKKSVMLAEGTLDREENIGVIPGATVRGVCYLDANYNGLYDEGEPVLKGVKLEVIRQNKGTVSGKTVSDENGAFLVDGLRASVYKIRVIVPEGHFFTKTNDAPGGNRFKAQTGRREYSLQDVTLSVGGEIELAIGVVRPGSISGVCYEDDDFSGMQNGKEKAVSGLTVALLDEKENVVATTRTTAKGKYEFSGLVPGVYTVSLNAKSGYAFTKLGEGNVILNTGNGAGKSEAFFLSLGEDRAAMHCGMILPGTVQGVLFADLNDNGSQDAGEAGLPGAVVRLMDESGEVFAAQTDASGAYCFDAVMPGRYCVAYQLPESGVFAKAPAGSAVKEINDYVGTTDWFDFAMADQVTMPVCGALTLSRVSGLVFHDANVNGVMDAGEAPVEGVVITLTPASADNETAQVATESDGEWVLSGLRPDTYALEMRFPDGQVLSNAAYLALPLQAGSRGDAVSLPLPMGTVMADQQLGVVVGASVSGRLWMDANDNGIMDEDEPGMPGETVTVTDDRTGAVFAVLTTDANGEFRTDSIAMVPGSYTLTHTLLADRCAAQLGDSSFTAEEDHLVLRGLTVGEGENRSGIKAGIVCLTTMAGHVWTDRGGAVEALPGAQVALLDASRAVIAQTQSDESGAYAFRGLLPGEYALSVTLPAGQVVVEPEDERLTSGGLRSVMAVCTGRSAVSAPIGLQMAQDRTDLDIGGVLPARVGDLVWLDVNGNGLQDSGEYGIPNVALALMRGGEVVAETVTDQYGYYYFTDVYPATYTLRAAAPAEVQPTAMRPEIAGVSSILQEDGDSAPFTVESGKRFYNADLGYKPVTPGVYPAGYGQGKTQDWTKLGSAD